MDEVASNTNRKRNDIDYSARERFGKWLKAYRTKKGLAGQRLADKIGTRVQFIYKLEGGTASATAAHIEAFCEMWPELDRMQLYALAGRIPQSYMQAFGENPALGYLVEKLRDKPAALIADMAAKL